jgi:hypothetical protein
MTPLFKKLQFKDQKTIHVINGPESFNLELEQMKHLAEIKSTVNAPGKIVCVIVFVKMLAEIENASKHIFPLLESDALLWFAYPKGSSKKYTCEFNRDTGWAAIGAKGFEPVRQVAIDEDWSALRFRKVEHIKTMIRQKRLTNT